MNGVRSRTATRLAAVLLVATFGIGTTVHFGLHSAARTAHSDSGCFACQFHQSGVVQTATPPAPAVESRPVPALPEPARVFPAPQRRLPEPRGPPIA